MAIYSQCSDLETRETMWVARKTETAPQTRYAGMICPAETWWWAGVHADAFHDEAIAALPLFTHDD